MTLRSPENLSPVPTIQKGPKVPHERAQPQQSASVNEHDTPKPWDPPGLPPKTPRCRWHNGLCAYRDDDPTRCTLCHANQSCTCTGGPITPHEANQFHTAHREGFTAKEIATDAGRSAREVQKILTHTEDAA